MAIKSNRPASGNNPHSAPMTTSAGVQVPAGMEAIYADAQKSMEGFVPATKGVPPSTRMPDRILEREVTEPGKVKTLYGKKAAVSVDPSVHGPLNASPDNPRFQPGGEGLVVSTPPTTRIARYRDPSPTPMSSPQFLGFSTAFPDPTLTVNNRGEAVHASSIFSDPNSFRWAKPQTKDRFSTVDLDTAAGPSVAQYWVDYPKQSERLESLTGLRGGAPRDEQLVGIAAAQAMQTKVYDAAGKARKADSRTVNEGITRAAEALGMDRAPSNEYIDMADPEWDPEQIDVVATEAGRRVRTGLMVEDEMQELMQHGERKPNAELPGMKGIPGVPRYTPQGGKAGGTAGDSPSVASSIDKSNRLHREAVQAKADKAKAEKKAAAEAAAKAKAEEAAKAAKSKKGKKK